MLDKIKNYIMEYKMINEGDRIVVGVSGGADSVCLFHVLLDLLPHYHITLFVVHVNHGLRPGDADRDEEYVRALCERHGVYFHSAKVNLSDLVQKGLSLEEAGRIARYEEFNLVLQRNKCNKIAIAHNKNDNAETILFHMFRGSGLKGLRGILPVRDKIIRPLLVVERDEIEYYLQEKAIEYCNDYTNQTDEYSRNKVRNHILKYAKENINSKAIVNINRAGNQIGEVYEYLEKKINEAYRKLVIYNSDEDSYIIPVKGMMQEDKIILRGIVRKIFESILLGLRDIDFLHIELVLSLLEKDVGKSISLPYGLIALKEYDNVVMKRNIHSGEKKLGKGTLYLEINDTCKEYYIPTTNQRLQVKLINYKKNMIIPQNGCTKWFDYDKIKNTVLIRTRCEGDYIQIDAKGSKKKIKSLFIDDKVPRNERDLLPLIADGSHIMWVIGSRMSEGYKISGETKLILEISLDGGN